MYISEGITGDWINKKLTGLNKEQYIYISKLSKIITKKLQPNLKKGSDIIWKIESKLIPKFLLKTGFSKKAVNEVMIKALTKQSCDKYVMNTLNDGLYDSINLHLKEMLYGKGIKNTYGLYVKPPKNISDPIIMRFAGDDQPLSFWEGVYARETEINGVSVIDIVEKILSEDSFEKYDQMTFDGSYAEYAVKNSKPIEKYFYVDLAKVAGLMSQKVFNQYKSTMPPKED